MNVMNDLTYINLHYWCEFFCSNPCTPENAADGEFYFPHHDSDKFVQCSEWGQCYIMQCPPGTNWNPAVTNCT